MIHLPHAKGITRRSRPEPAEPYFRSSALVTIGGEFAIVGGSATGAATRVPEEALLERLKAGIDQERRGWRHLDHQEVNRRRSCDLKR
jgi:hypothetical protein